MKTPESKQRKVRTVLILFFLGLWVPSLAAAGEMLVDVQGHGDGDLVFVGSCAAVSAEDYPSCGRCGPSCQVEQVMGTAKWQHIGTFEWTADFAVDPTTATPNSAGGHCFTAYGESLHQMNNGEITLAVIVSLCNAGVGDTPPVLFHGAYTVQDGTGQFQNASGFGNIAGGIDASGRMLVNVDGTLVRDAE